MTSSCRVSDEVITTARKACRKAGYYNHATETHAHCTNLLVSNETRPNPNPSYDLSFTPARLQYSTTDDEDKNFLYFAFKQKLTQNWIHPQKNNAFCIKQNVQKAGELIVLN